MNILLVSPEPPADNAGNETTSARWSRLLEDLGHTTEIAYEYDASELAPDIDVLVAMHAYKSAPAVDAYRRDHPQRPLVVALTGTDLYKYRPDRPEVDTNIERADALVVLQEAALRELDAEARDKTRVIPQSLGRLEDVSTLGDDGDGAADTLDDDAFNVCFAAHLRDVKDPLRTARAARRLDTDSKLRVVHVGRALSDEWTRRAEDERRANPRYDWHGEVPRRQALAVITGSDLLTSTSRLEGGPNVVSEAIALGTPVVATEIPGHVGLLGPDYPGYVPPEDTDALADMLRRAETDPDFYEALVETCRERAPAYQPDREREAWRELLETLSTRRPSP